MAMSMAAMRLLRGSARPARPLALSIPRLHPSSHTHLSYNSSKPDPKPDTNTQSKLDSIFQALKKIKVSKPNINISQLSKALEEVYDFIHSSHVTERAEKVIKDLSWAWTKTESLIDMMPPQIKEELRKQLLGLPVETYNVFKTQLIALGCAKFINLLGIGDAKGPVLLFKTVDSSVNLEGLLKSLNAKTVFIIPIQDDLDWNKFKVNTDGAEKNGNTAEKNGNTAEKNGNSRSEKNGNTGGAEKNGKSRSEKNGNTGGAQKNGNGAQKNGSTGSEKNGNTGSEKNGKTGAEKNGKTSSEKNGNTGSEKNGNTGSEKNGKISFEKNGNTGSEKNGKIGSEKNGNTGSEKNGKIGSEKNGKTGSEKNGKTGSEKTGNSGSEKNV